MVVEPGETDIELPVPTEVTPQPPVYQFHEAPVPKEPPMTDNVVAPPQVGFTLADILAGVVDNEFTVTDVSADVALQPLTFVTVTE